MNMVREEDPRFRNLERKIGIFISVAIGGIAIAMLMFGLQKDFFTKKYHLRFTADRGTGFVKGMPVKLSGFRIGRITTIALNDQAMVDITIEIDNKYRTWIRSDSFVKLVKEGLVGDNIIDVVVGSLDKPELKDNESILYVKTKGLDEMADEIAEKVKPVLIEISDIISYVNNPEGDLKKTIRNLEQLTRNLEETRRHADKLLVSATTDIDRISSQATLSLDSARQKIESIDLTPALNRVNSTLDQIDTNLPRMLQKADATLDNINRVSHETRVMSEKAFPKIPALISQTEDVLLSSDRLINSIQDIWLFRRSPDPAPKKEFLRGDSYE